MTKSTFVAEVTFKFICEFSIFQNISFIEHLLETALLMYKLQNFNQLIEWKTIWQVLFKHFIQEQEVAIRRCSFTSQPTQRRRKNVLKTSYFWSQRRLRLVSNGSRDDLFLRRCQDVFQEMSLRRLRLH